MDNDFLFKLFKNGQISKDEYESLKLKEVVAGTGYNDLEGLQDLEEAEVVVPEEASYEYKGMKQRVYPWIDSTNEKAPQGSDGIPVILAKSDEKLSNRIKVAKIDEVPLLYSKTKKVTTKRDYEILDKDIEIIRDIERATYRSEQQVMTYAETEEDIEDIYEIGNPVIKIGSNKDWYLIYDEQEDKIEISDLCVYGTINAENNLKIEGSDAKLAIAESTYEIYKLLLECQNDKKSIYCNATADTSFRNLKNMLKKGLINLKDFDGNELVLEGNELINNETGEEIETRSWDNSEIKMVDLQIIPNKEKIEAEIGKIQKYLYRVQSLYRTKGTKKEKGIDELRSEIR